MLQNNNPTTITNRTKEPVINSRYELTELNLESVAKLPKLQQIIDQWKLQIMAQPKNLDRSLMLSDSQFDDKQIFIDHLTRKVDFLESKISHLCQKHVEICIMLCAELEKKKVNEQTLRQENIELNKQMKDVMNQMKEIINKFYNSNEAQGERLRRNSQMLNLKFSKKQNIPPSNNINEYRMSGDKLHSKSPRQTQHHRHFKIFSSKSILKSQISLVKTQITNKQLQGTTDTRDKKEQIDDLYYKKSKEHIKKGQSQFKLSSQKTKCTHKKKDSKTYAEDYF